MLVSLFIKDFQLTKFAVINKNCIGLCNGSLIFFYNMTTQMLSSMRDLLTINKPISETLFN